ncbi:uncharacterized protein LOC132557276 [Ylistrum balloti]|uniref:uncharacterized protein LOC132557276 n=1 Tax=Ylistrum balloti TaxID=509963 RepID=UPI002905B80B|nr:uncharacterized protein LOC132557276 [Ylistrum balloti]
MGSVIHALTLLSTLVGCCFGYECDSSATVCETTLIISHQQTMLHPTEGQVYPVNGKLYRYDDVNQTTIIPTDEVMTADGWENNRLVTVANESLPGPPIIVYVGQRVKVHVINALLSDTVTVHWHGLPLYGSPHMDGTPFVTQCPILPGQKFTYDFTADPKGTHWYHSHAGNQRAKGMHGAFIIKERTSTAREHIMTVEDWNHHWGSDMDVQKMKKAQVFIGRNLQPIRSSVDGGLFLPFIASSVLINGRGRFYNETGQDNGAPLTEFSVDAGTTYRFRVIHTGVMYPIRVSVDHHRLTVVASDGFEIQPVVAESFIVAAGERFDFEINTNQTIGSYWIRAETIEVNSHKTEAVLRYTGADPSRDPITSRKVCSPTNRCLVVNCPFETYPSDTYTDCINFDQLKSAINDPPPEPTSSDDFKEHHLNFGIVIGRPSVNGIVFQTPKVSALSQPFEVGPTCDKNDCGEDTLCNCMHSISTNFNDVVQLVLMNTGMVVPAAHPIHLHGYSFYVLKTGFGTYNTTSAKFISPNMDIDCRGNGDMSFCNQGTWRNSTWLGNNVPDLNLINPPKKDTLNMPYGSYAVIRYKANNPGVWMLHCHVQVHMALGMSLLINSSYGMHPVPPKGFPVCHDFPSAFRERLEDYQQQSPTTPAQRQNTATPEIRLVTQIVKEDDIYGISSFWAMFGVLVAVILVLSFYILTIRKKLYLYKKKYDDSSSASKQANDNRSFSKL